VPTVLTGRQALASRKDAPFSFRSAWRTGMIGYGGGTTNKEQVAQLEKAGWGMMIGPVNPKKSALRYAVDNGAYPAWAKKKPWSEAKFLKMLDRVQTFERKPDFICCPDIVAAGPASLDFSMAWRDQLPKDWPVYLAVQDGMTPCGVLAVLDRFAGIFVGGTQTWKRNTSPLWARLARSEGKQLHVGRINSLQGAFVQAKVVKADSFDGNNWNRLWENNQKPERVVNDSQGALDLYGLH
jgi:hypothetical protein